MNVKMRNKPFAKINGWKNASDYLIKLCGSLCNDLISMEGEEGRRLTYEEAYEYCNEKAMQALTSKTVDQITDTLTISKYRYYKSKKASGEIVTNVHLSYVTTDFKTVMSYTRGDCARYREEFGVFRHVIREDGEDGPVYAIVDRQRNSYDMKKGWEKKFRFRFNPKVASKKYAKKGLGYKVK